MDGSRLDTADLAMARRAADPLDHAAPPRSRGLDAAVERLGPRGRRLAAGALLAGCDVIALWIAIWLVAGSMRAVGGLSDGTLPDFVGAFSLAAPLFALLGASFGLYGGQGLDPFARFRLRTRITVLFFGASAVMGALAPPLIPALLLFAPAATLVTVVLGSWTETALRRVFAKQTLWAEPVVVLGCGPESCALASRLLAHPEFGLRPIGHLDDGEPRFGHNLMLPVLGSAQAAADLDRWASVVDAAVAPDAVVARLLGRRPPDALPFRRMVIVPSAPPPSATRVELCRLGHVVGLDVRRGAETTARRWTKRAVDVMVAGPMLLLALPIILLAAAAIRAISPGSPFYAQRRVGHGGQPLLVPKLRSMYPDAERRLQEHLAADPAARAEWDRYVKLSRDPRVLPVVGTFIRRASLDELPQLWSIVRGGMSLVGPRPFPEYHTERFDPEFRALRASVPPGLTGLWQVSSRSDGDLDRQKDEDTFYVRNWSLVLDLYILIQTLPAVIFAKGAR